MEITINMDEISGIWECIARFKEILCLIKADLSAEIFLCEFIYISDSAKPHWNLFQWNLFHEMQSYDQNQSDKQFNNF